MGPLLANLSFSISDCPLIAHLSTMALLVDFGGLAWERPLIAGQIGQGAPLVAEHQRFRNDFSSVSSAPGKLGSGEEPKSNMRKGSVSCQDEADHIYANGS